MSDQPRDRAELRQAIAGRLVSAVDDSWTVAFQVADDVLDLLDKTGVLCPHEPMQSPAPQLTDAETASLAKLAADMRDRAGRIPNPRAAAPCLLRRAANEIDFLVHLMSDTPTSEADHG